MATEYLSRVYYTGDGTTSTWTIPFSYINQSHIHIYLDGVETTNFTWLTSNTISITPGKGVLLLIKRETTNTKRLIEYQNASLTNSNDFNLEGNQEFYINQEALDGSSTVMGLNETLNWGAQNKRIQNLATPVNPKDAATREYADGGNLTACEEQVVLAANQVTIATEQATIATNQAAIATEQAMLASQAAYDPLGIIKGYFGTILPNRHLWCNGLTIGDASSGATALASADAKDLFTVLWNVANTTNSQIKLYNSAGTVIAKGIDAATDFEAHFQLSLPDLRGRVSMGLDNMGGTSKNVVTADNADVLGGTAGDENHVLINLELPKINTTTGGDSPDHAHIETYGTGKYAYQQMAGQGQCTIGADANLRADSNSPLYTSGASARHTHSVSFGGGGAHSNMQPWIACNYIIRY
jgi:microcystin-dependent protein